MLLVQQPGSVPHFSNSRLSPLPPEPAFSNSVAAHDATVEIPLGGAKVSFLILLKHDMWMPTRADANQGLPW
jgi:hypothetical protein